MATSGGGVTRRNVRTLSWVVDAAVLLYVALDLVAQLLPPHYSPISQAESDLAVGRYGYVMTLNFVNRGAFSLVFLYAFMRPANLADGTRRRYRNGAALIGFWGVGAFLLAVFPTDVPSTPVSGHGAIHLLVAILAFFAVSIGELWISAGMGDDPALMKARSFALPIAVLGFIALLLMLALPFAAPHFASNVAGLTERIFLGISVLWIFLMSLHLGRS